MTNSRPLLAAATLAVAAIALAGCSGTASQAPATSSAAPTGEITLIQPVFDTLRRWGAGSAFIASRALIDRVQLLPPATIAAPVGAALLGDAAMPAAVFATA
ncbi:hypothetical protein GCM10009860_22620 [Microbacterium mitrae]|uniref:Uncharacterized protein n=1 Tax=Microbacterium mitrae TaxID=664640 RepID=A0A5C8HLE0_9MICO|nr:hypothetical protein [Microbacterium mitrae]TXK04055.1 hypothetical protein FVP60_09805 [Microbacterium mitrae]